jgi:hypothetical protein
MQAQSGSPLILLAVAADVSLAVTAQEEIQTAMQRVILGIIILGVVAFAIFYYLRSIRVQRQVAQSAFARTFCFVCSRPLDIEQRFPVGLPLGGQAREVSACRQHAEELTAGSQPEVTAVNHEGRLIPWFAAPEYDPSLDYRSPPAGLLPLATVTSEFAAAAMAQSSTPSALSAAQSSEDWWKAAPSEPASGSGEWPRPAATSSDSNDRPTNRAPQAP